MPANPRTEPVAMLVALVDGAWDTANTGGEKPVIVDGGSGRKDRLTSAGFILVYQDGPFTRERNDVNGNFKTHRMPVTFDVHALSRAKLDSLLGELERILNLNRNNPDGYWDWMEDLGETPLGQFPESSRTTVQVQLVANSIAVAE